MELNIDKSVESVVSSMSLFQSVRTIGSWWLPPSSIAFHDLKIWVCFKSWCPKIWWLIIISGGLSHWQSHEWWFPYRVPMGIPSSLHGSWRIPSWMMTGGTPSWLRKPSYAHQGAQGVRSPTSSSIFAWIMDLKTGEILVVGRGRNQIFI